MKPKFCTLLVRQHCGVFTAAAQNIEMSGLSATIAARAAGARLLGVPEHMVEIEVVDHGERGSTRQILRATVKRPRSATAWEYLVVALIALSFAGSLMYCAWQIVKGVR